MYSSFQEELTFFPLRLINTMTFLTPAKNYSICSGYLEGFNWQKKVFIKQVQQIELCGSRFYH